MEKLMLIEEIHSEHSILELILYMLLPEEFWALIFGKMVQKRQKLTLILISLTIPRLVKKLRWKSKMKPIKSFLKDILLANISKERKKLNQSMVSTFIKVVSFLEIKLEL
jgi:hypothetical protein